MIYFKLKSEIKKKEIIIKKKRKIVSFELILYKLFYKKLFKDLLWKKKFLDSCFPDLIAKNLNFIKKIQIVFSVNKMIKNTKNKKLAFTLFLFLFKFGISNFVDIFFKYNSKYKKFHEFTIIFVSSLELDCYGSIKNSLISLTNGFFLEKNFKCLPKEYLRVLILFLKKINRHILKNKNKQNYTIIINNIKRILNAVVYIISCMQIWFHFEDYFLNFFHILVKEIWNLHKIDFIVKFFEKITKTKYIMNNKLCYDLFQSIISQIHTENTILFQFLNQIDSILKVLKPKCIDICKSKIKYNIELKQKQFNNKFYLNLKNQNEFNYTKNYFM